MGQEKTLWVWKLSAARFSPEILKHVTLRLLWGTQIMRLGSWYLDHDSFSLSKPQGIHPHELSWVSHSLIVWYFFPIHSWFVKTRGSTRDIDWGVFPMDDKTKVPWKPCRVAIFRLPSSNFAPLNQLASCPPIDTETEISNWVSSVTLVTTFPKSFGEAISVHTYPSNLCWIHHWMKINPPEKNTTPFTPSDLLSLLWINAKPGGVPCRVASWESQGVGELIITGVPFKESMPFAMFTSAPWSKTCISGILDCGSLKC